MLGNIKRIICNLSIHTKCRPSIYFFVRIILCDCTVIW
ncbi:hypothetical protein BCAH820_B0095 (plasmid) [Bacillus cereus AH820]|uniref:Uncharacterized protein n=1 Tax=Bacillus cereus (strain AH820) TaxID=405535 RepID=B7JTJ4_BACC0|nr:hypothetical protein BCAH820_B0095 [Bacillus cereus AH820]